jgi:HAD superfamily hydrolase (TIGR01509 family)
LIEYIQNLRRLGMPVVLATNQEQYRTQYMLDHMGFAEAFDKVYSSAHLGLKKPALEFYAKIVGDLEVEKEDVLFWDDDQVNIDGALQFGLQAEFYTNYESFLSIMVNKYGLKT